MRINLGKALLALLLTSSSTALAGQYILEKGQGVPVCEAYLKSINSRKPALPYTCARPANASLGFQVPNWEELFGKSLIPTGINLTNKIDKYLWQRDANPVYYVTPNEWSQWRGTKKQMREAWNGYESQRNARLAPNGPKYAIIDINNDGKPEPVYFEDGCGTSYGSLLLVLNKTFSDVDRVKTELVMPHPNRKDTGWKYFRKNWPGEEGAPIFIKQDRHAVEDSLHWAHYNVFSYENQYYFDSWWRAHVDYKGKSDLFVGKLRVFSAVTNKTTEVCTYRFDMNAK